jgi:hypothetical protein
MVTADANFFTQRSITAPVKDISSSCLLMRDDVHAFFIWPMAFQPIFFHLSKSLKQAVVGYDILSLAEYDRTRLLLNAIISKLLVIFSTPAPRTP